MPAATLDILRTAILKHDLGQHTEELLGLVKPCITLNREQIDPAALSKEDSSIGGNVAFLPPGTEWPMSDTWFMEPLASILLSQASAVDVEGLLPKRGRLTFWYDVQNSPWGFEPKDRTGFRVMYIADEDAPLERRVVPGRTNEWCEPDQPTTTCKVVFSRGFTLPSLEDMSFELRKRMNIVAYMKLLSEMESPCAQHLLGHPALIQGSMQEEAHCVSQGVEYRTYAEDEDKCSGILQGSPTDWQLLLQLDSDGDGPGWCWGDCGRLYFWIRRQDLARARFEDCWQFLQCS